MSTRVLTNEEDDQLKEITNIGIGNASTALSTMIGKKVTMTVPESFIGGIEKVQRLIGSVDEKVVAIFLKFHGEIEGAMVMILSPDSALNFVNILTQEPGHNDINNFDENDKSSLQEMGNILLGASITAINKFLNLSLLHTIPDISIDKSGAVLDSVLIEMGATSGEILAFRIKLDIEQGLTGDFYYLFDPISSGKILEMVKEKIK